MIWVERKVHGDMTNRIGPNRAGPWGILQTLADGAKLFTKEGLIPDKADRLGLTGWPRTSRPSRAFLIFAVVPFGGDFNDGKDGTISILSNRTYLQLFDGEPGILLILVLSRHRRLRRDAGRLGVGVEVPAARLGPGHGPDGVGYEAALGLSPGHRRPGQRRLSTHDIVAGPGRRRLRDRPQLEPGGLRRGAVRRSS